MALSFGLNANLVCQWLRRRGFEQGADGLASVAASDAVSRGASGQRFVALAVPRPVPANPAVAPVPTADIRIEVRRGGMQVSVSWPQSAAADCAAWLRDLLR